MPIPPTTSHTAQLHLLHPNHHNIRDSSRKNLNIIHRKLLRQRGEYSKSSEFFGGFVGAEGDLVEVEGAIAVAVGQLGEYSIVSEQYRRIYKLTQSSSKSQSHHSPLS